MAIKVEINYLGVELIVTGDYMARVRAKLGGPPEDCHPEEPSDFDIEDVKVGGVSIIEMLACFVVPHLTQPVSYCSALGEIAEACREKLDEDYE
jgi:hypothetical protein